MGFEDALGPHLDKKPLSVLELVKKTLKEINF